ncbi:outer membrane autotransporter barrel domain-containing protein [Asticcacaulis biprosthecium C19]|uniref:Outer membrane autotransporter barrel domain-containing protein n=1 Tax=Asticcacaulis biprosthecium C19 TaxID=715226 RepID=F4QM42_9CAUL|nr:autotransporter domain-containing protein [Asticcacaulis biprosthecium]EGF93614.1 outer membrane autotransporter barrel domain-containing protein [Asticcacaulis biprosthecium C19]
MRRHALLAATGLGLVLATPTFAATSISTATTAPMATSTTGDTTVTSDGSITLTQGTAITLDSDNVLDFEGTIDMTESASDSTGLWITDVPGRTQTLTIDGDISVTDDFDAEDSNDDDVTDAPFAEGTGRYGIRSTGASPFTGDVSVSSTSAISVQGNQSYGIRFENGIDGDVTFDGSLSLIGDQSTGIALDQGVTGNVYLSGSVGAYGKDSSAITLNGDIGGSLILDGTYTGAAYSLTYRPDQDIIDGLDPALNLLQSGPLVSVSGNVANGILFGAAPTSEDDDNTDEDGDGLTDSDQSTASLVLYGGAPAFRLGSADQDIAIGGVSYTDTAIDPSDVNYGLLVRGSIAGYGIFDGVASKAVQIGGMGHAVTIDNGIGVDGSLASYAYAADSTALSLESGTATPRLDITGSILGSTATVTTSDEIDGEDVYTTVGGGKTARAVAIASGADLPILTVAEGASISATATGSTANATAIEDRSNTLTRIDTSGGISASVTATDDNGDDTADSLTGSAIAIDTRTNTVGLALTQTDNAPEDDDIAAPYIYGRILLGSGHDAVSSSGGLIYGDIDFGAGTGSLILSDEATYAGSLTSSGGIAMALTGGSAAVLYSGTHLNLNSLYVDSDSTLGLTLDSDNPATAPLINSGASVFDDGATLNLSLDKLVTTPTQFRLLTSASIDLGDIESSTRDGYVPYLYHADLELNDAATELSANFRLKTQAEAGYSDNQYTALMPVLSALGADTGGQVALLSETDKAGFDQVYNQYLPDYSGENLLSLSLGSQSVNRSLGALTVIPDNDGGQYWLQQYGYSTSRDTGDTAGFNAATINFAGGRERELYGNQMVGVYLSLTASTPEDAYAIYNEASAASDLTLGGYWRLRMGAMKAWAHAGAGYVQLESTRNLLNTYAIHTSKARWTGWSQSAGAGISYGIKAGGLVFTPEWTADFYGLSENGRSESGGGDSFDLTIGARDGHLLSTTAQLRAGTGSGMFRPEIWLGYRQNISANLSETVANFAGGDRFALSAGNLEGGGPVAGFRIAHDSDYSHIGIEAQYEKLEAYDNASIALRTRFQF